MQRLMSVFLVAVAACGGGSGGDPMGLDASGGGFDASNSSDGAAFQGLTVVWEDAPAIPGPQNLSTMVTVTSAKFHIKKLEVIGDAGDPINTTKDDFDILWDATTSPFPITFFTAPAPAIYSKVRLSIDKGSSDAPSVEIMGTVVINSNTEMFKITTIEKNDLEVRGYNVALGVGESETIPVIVGVDALLANVNWGALPNPGGVRTLDESSASALDAFLDHLEDTFTSPNE